MAVIQIDFTPQLCQALRNMIREELCHKADELQEKPKFYTRQEACDVLHISLPTLDTYIRAGVLSAIKGHRKVFIPETSLKAFAEGFKSRRDSK